MQGLMEQRVVVSGEVVELAEAAYAGVVRRWVGGVLIHDEDPRGASQLEFAAASMDVLDAALYFFVFFICNVRRVFRMLVYAFAFLRSDFLFNYFS
jgi:hypothetical protein